jgi:hypothetical protein
MQLKITRPQRIAVVLVAAMGIAAVGAWGYFTNQSWLQLGSAHTGRLEIVASTDNYQSLSDGLLPGEHREIEWNVQNTGVSPVHIRTGFQRDWSDQGKDAQMLQITEVNYSVDAQTWESAHRPEDSGWWYLSQDNEEAGLLTLDAGETVTVKTKVQLDPSA